MSQQLVDVDDASRDPERSVSQLADFVAIVILIIGFTAYYLTR